jgi:thioredoxin-dependent peroxiredoxin
MTIEIGDTVPDFTFQATNNVSGKLSDYRGKTVVLYFYPKDHTPGCTQEGQDFRDAIKKFEKTNAVIFGISRDKLATHEKFKAKHELPFELISDPESELCNLFEVLWPKNMFGKIVNGIVRSTFVIDANGVLRQAWRKVKVGGHAEAVLQQCKKV